MNALRAFSDIVDSIGAIPDIHIVKILGAAKSVKLLAMTESRSAVVYGTMHGPIEGLNGVVGFHPHKLREVLKSPGIDHVETKLRVVQGNGKEPYIEIWTDRSQHRFAPFYSRCTNEQVRVGTFLRPKYEFSLTPTSSGIELFKYWTKQEAEVCKEVRFWPTIDRRGRLHFQLDQGPMPTQMMRFIFESNLPLQTIAPNSYPAQLVLDVLKLLPTSKYFKMNFADAGVLAIDVDSGLGKYEFIFPGDTDVIWRNNLASQWGHVWGVETMMRNDQSMHCDWEPAL